MKRHCSKWTGDFLGKRTTLRAGRACWSRPGASRHLPSMLESLSAQQGCWLTPRPKRTILVPTAFRVRSSASEKEARHNSCSLESSLQDWNAAPYISGDGHQLSAPVLNFQQEASTFHIPGELH